MPQRLDAYRGVKVTEQKGTTYEQDALELAGGNPDPDLEELIFQFARYLMISSSRPGCMPANLQGLWNQSNRPPWRSDYHSDVNIQMNYWFVDHANLSECFTPLSEWLYSVVPIKREATKEKFGVRGWAHRSENGIFGGASYKWIPGDAPWILQNIWDHYAFTQDQEYLKLRAYPLLKEQCEFWEDSLIQWPDGKLVSPKSVSPEHGPLAEGNSYEQQLVYDLFTNYVEAAKELGVDETFRNKVEEMRSRLLGPQIGKWGQLQEWAEDRDDPNDKHRHLSHLIAVHPGRQISPLTTPELAEAARVSMNARGDGGTGWSKAWKISIWARLHDGNRAYKLLKEQINGNFYGNLLSFHPPFQIDGNFGYAAGVCEMLVQSHMGQIHLLPALPDAWSAGNVKGLKARGGFELDCRWKDGEISEAVIRSMHGGPCRVRSAVCLTVTQDGREVATRTVADELIEFSTTENAEYCLKATPRDVD
jgi:alpha-L-fucosidase 2